MSAKSGAAWPWSVLGLPGPDDTRAIKRAYAQCLKAINRGDPAEFQALRSAYDSALKQADTGERQDLRSRPSIRQLTRGEDTDTHAAELPAPVGDKAQESPPPLLPSGQTGEPPASSSHLELPKENSAAAAKPVKLDQPGGETIATQPPKTALSPLPAKVSAQRSPAADLLANARAALSREDVAGLRKIMAQIQPGDFATRRQIEQATYESLALRVERREKISIPLIIWIDEEFFWLSETRLAEGHFSSPQNFRSFAAKLAQRRDHCSLPVRFFRRVRNVNFGMPVLDLVQVVAVCALFLIVTIGTLRDVITDWSGPGQAGLEFIIRYVLAFVGVILVSLPYFLLWIFSYPLRLVLRPLFRYLTDKISYERRERLMSRLGLHGKKPVDICVTIGFVQASIMFMGFDLFDRLPGTALLNP